MLESQNHSKLRLLFFKHLKYWITELEKVDFLETDLYTKKDLVMSLLNKLILKQLLEDFLKISHKILEKDWQMAVKKKQTKGSKFAVTTFFITIFAWFKKKFPINMFENNEFNFLKDNEENWDGFYKILNTILGFEDNNSFQGICQFPFKNVDVDIIGQSYEYYLAQLRNERGIYYTPSHVSNYMATTLIKSILEPFLLELKRTIPKREETTSQKILKEIINFKILDPSCGSGTFLVKAFRYIYQYYQEVIQLIQSYYTLLNSDTKNTGFRQTVNEFGLQKKPSSLLALILRRHIWGVDLDKKAISIAQLNLWIEMIKLASKKINITEMIEETSVFPNLDLNLIPGNSIIQIPKKFVEDYLKSNKEEGLRLNSLIKERELLSETPLCHQESKSLKQEFENFFNDLKDEFLQIMEKSPKKWPYLKKVLFDSKANLELCDFHWNVHFHKTKFSGIIGNPPYVDVKQMPVSISAYLRKSKEFNFSYNRVDYFCAFSELATRIDLLDKKGVFCFIVPTPILSKSSYSKFREFWLQNHCITQLIRLPNNTFDDIILQKKVITEPVIIVSRNDRPNDKTITETIVFDGNSTIVKIDKFQAKISRREVQKTWIEPPNYIISLEINPKDRYYINLIEQKSIALSKISNFSLGITPYDKYKGHSDEIIRTRAFHLDYDNKTDTKRLLSGENVTRYGLSWDSKKWLRYGNFLGAPREWRFFNEPRILVRQIRTGSRFLRILATYTEIVFVNTQSIFNLIVSEKRYPTKYVLALLNSALMSWYYTKRFMDPQKKAQSKVLIQNAKQLPIKLASRSEIKKIIEIVDKILVVKANEIHCDPSFIEKYPSFSDLKNLYLDLDSELEARIFRIYGADQKLLEDIDLHSKYKEKIQYYLNNLPKT